MKKYLFVLLISLMIGLIYVPNAVAGNTSRSLEVRTHTPTNATIEITYQGTWPAAAQTALEYAVNIWEPLVDSPLPIRIIATWGEPFNTPLASTLILTYVKSSSLPISYAYYPRSLANAILGSTSCPTCDDMELTFDSSLPNWYFGTDGQPTGTQYDFVTVALRQIGLGLGFAHSFRYYPQNGMGQWGTPTYPRIYDLFLFNGSNQQLVDTSIFPNPSAALYAQMISNNIFFSGPLTLTVNNNNPARLYAPASWGADSFTYLDEATYPTSTTNGLITPVIQPGEVIHHPGSLTLAILEDMGWPHPNLTPTFAELPDQFVQMNTALNNAIDLWVYVNDDDPDNQLIFQIINTPAAGAGITLDNNRYIDINPDLNWVGQTTVIVRVTDPSQASSTGSFSVTVADLPFRRYLPGLRHP